MSLSFSKEGVCISYKTSLKDEHNGLAFIESDAANLPSKLKEFIIHEGLSGALCNICLPQKDYLLVQTEKPSVPDEEVNEAIKWKIGDLIPWDISKITVDTYDSPEGSYSQTKNIKVVVVKDETIKEYVDLCLSCELDLQAIEIAELSLSRLNFTSNNLSSNIAVILFFEQSSLITFFHEKTLYLSRKIELGSNIFTSNELDITEQGHYERITLDLQRSLDHFESTFNIGTIQQIILLPESDKTKYFVDYLSQNLSLKVNNQSLLGEKWFNLLKQINSSERATGLTAISSLLRFSDG